MFKQILEELINHTQGAFAALVVDLDGLLIDSCGRSEGCNFEQMAAHFSQLLKNSAEMTSSLQSSSLMEVSFVASDLRVVMRVLAGSYSVVLLLSEGANLGQARFELRKIQFDLEKELAV